MGDKKNASTEKKLLSKKSQKKLVTWNPKESVNTSPNWFLFLSQPKNALISQKKYVLVPEPTQERSKSQLSRNGVTYQLLNLVWLKPISERFRCIAHFNYTYCLSNFLFGYLYMHDDDCYTDKSSFIFGACIFYSSGIYETIVSFCKKITAIKYSAMCSY